MKLLLDTNVISYALRGREAVVSNFSAALADNAAFLLSEVVDYELRRYLLLKKARRQLVRYEELVANWERTRLDPGLWRTAAAEWAGLHARGWSIEDRDLLIAVTAMKEDALLVTANVRHFERLEVQTQDWTKG